MATTKTAIHICSKEIEIALLQQELAHIRKDIAEIKEAVVGNGHPGLKERMDKAEGGLTMVKIGMPILIAIVGMIVAIIKI